MIYAAYGVQIIVFNGSQRHEMTVEQFWQCVDRVLGWRVKT